jgi:hypothetical protein
MHRTAIPEARGRNHYGCRESAPSFLLTFKALAMAWAKSWDCSGFLSRAWTAARLVGKLRPAEAAHEQDRDIRADLPQARGKLGTNHARHELIGYREIKTRRPRLECLKGRLGLSWNPTGSYAEGRDHLLTEEHERLIVVDEEDALLHDPWKLAPVRYRSRRRSLQN